VGWDEHAAWHVLSVCRCRPLSFSLTPFRASSHGQARGSGQACFSHFAAAPGQRPRAVIIFSRTTPRPFDFSPHSGSGRDTGDMPHSVCFFCGKPAVWLPCAWQLIESTTPLHSTLCTSTVSCRRRSISVLPICGGDAQHSQGSRTDDDSSLYGVAASKKSVNVRFRHMALA
jgi:hypothetical protein